MEAYDAIKLRRLRIPEDIAVVGFDNQKIIAAELHPRPTVLGSAESRELVSCALVERQSV
jgi:DNA-binding LacI/PurR family transcriptional regulator